MRRAILLRITGRVQGVWFRAWTAERARQLGLAGWVRNRRDGSVEALVAGPDEAVGEMVRACASGPPHAVVWDIAKSPADDPGDIGFEIRESV